MSNLVSNNDGGRTRRGCWIENNIVWAVGQKKGCRSKAIAEAYHTEDSNLDYSGSRGSGEEELG